MGASWTIHVGILVIMQCLNKADSTKCRDLVYEGRCWPKMTIRGLCKERIVCMDYL